MAGVVPDRTFNDPTSALINSLTGAFGTKEATSTSGGAAGIAGLQDVLNGQLAGTTPGGAADLIKAIFQTGLEQVPGLQTAYGQAAGARTSNNSPLALTMQDMMAKLSQQASLALQGNQRAAADTASKLTDATKTSTITKTPRASGLALLPFLLANMDKLKKPLGAIGDKASSLFNPSSSINSSIPGDNGLPSSPFSFSSNAGNNDFFSALGLDGSGSGAAALGSDIGNLGSSFGGFSDASGIADFGSSAGGAIDDVAGLASDVGNFGSDLFGDFAFNKGGYVSRSKPPTSMKATAKGYADGGEVEGDKIKNVRNTDRQSNKLGTGVFNQGQQIRGVTYNGLGDDFFDFLRGIVGTASSAGSTAIGGGSGSKQPGRPGSPRDPSEELDGSNGPSGEGVGLAEGETGPVSVSEAIGLATGIAGLATGFPVGAISNALGLTEGPTPMSPMSAITAVVNAVVNSITNPLSPETVDNAVDNAQAVSPDADNGFASDAANGNGVGNDAGDSGASSDAGNGNGDGGVGDGGSSDGGSSDGGGGGDGGTGGGDFAVGGEVSGPQGKDVIPAMLTDGEYVIKRDSVARIGLPLLHMLNNNPDAVINAMHAITGGNGSSADVSRVGPARKRA